MCTCVCSLIIASEPTDTEPQFSTSRCSSLRYPPSLPGVVTRKLAYGASCRHQSPSTPPSLHRQCRLRRRRPRQPGSPRRRRWAGRRVCRGHQTAATRRLCLCPCSRYRGSLTTRLGRASKHRQASHSQHCSHLGSGSRRCTTLSARTRSSVCSGSCRLCGSRASLARY